MVPGPPEGGANPDIVRPREMELACVEFGDAVENGVLELQRSEQRSLRGQVRVATVVGDQERGLSLGPEQTGGETTWYLLRYC